MERVGEVTAVNGGMLEVTFQRLDECEGCHACDGQPKKMNVRLEGEAKVGDMALVELSTATVLKASATAYLIPLAGLLLGLFITPAIFPGKGDGAAAIGALLGMALGAAAVTLTEKQRRGKTSWTPVIKRIIPAGQPRPACETPAEGVKT